MSYMYTNSIELVPRFGSLPSPTSTSSNSFLQKRTNRSLEIKTARSEKMRQKVFGDVYSRWQRRLGMWFMHRSVVIVQPEWGL